MQTFLEYIFSHHFLHETWLNKLSSSNFKNSDVEGIHVFLHTQQMDTQLVHVPPFQIEQKSCSFCPTYISPMHAKHCVLCIVYCVHENCLFLFRSRVGGAAATAAAAAANAPSMDLDLPVDPNEPTYCFCNQVSYGEMVACDNPDVCISFISIN